MGDQMGRPSESGMAAVRTELHRSFYFPDCARSDARADGVGQAAELGALRDDQFERLDHRRVRRLCTRPLRVPTRAPAARGYGLDAEIRGARRAIAQRNRLEDFLD